MAAAQEEARRHVRRPRPPPYMKVVSGSLGGIVEACCLHPIDVIKTRLQLDRTGSYRGIVHCGSTIARTEGVRAMWKGLTPFATHLTLKYSLRMGSNALFQSAFKDSRTGSISTHGRLFSGFGAGVLEALLIVTPFEEVVNCGTSHEKNANEFKRCIDSMIKKKLREKGIDPNTCNKPMPPAQHNLECAGRKTNAGMKALQRVRQWCLQWTCNR